MKFTEEQIKQIKKQIKAHRHEDYKIDMPIYEDFILCGFSIHESVLRPEKMTSLRFARWLFFNNGLYENKVVIDMGCGAGILGGVAGLMGAKRIIFTDISQKAYENTKENIKIFNLQGKSELVKGDLFENIKEKADVIIFNHPFFSDLSFEEYVSKTKIDENKGELMHRFLEDAKKHLKEKGVIVMNFFKLAGEVSDPEIQAPKHNYEVRKRFDFNIKTGIQRGRVTICELRLK